MAGKRSKQGYGMGKQQCQTPEGSAPKKVFKFLNLPPEIRNMIYWNVLVKKYYFYHFRQPSLTLVNKQIRSESLPILYGNSLFSFFVWRYDHTLEQIQGLSPMPPAMSNLSQNLSHITRLDIRFSPGLKRHLTDLVVEIHMRNKSDGGYLLDKELVGRPGLEWKDRASINAVCKRLLVDSLKAGNHYGVSAKLISMAFMEVDRVVRGLLYFAEKCPAAAEWVWMGLEDTP